MFRKRDSIEAIDPQSNRDRGEPPVFDKEGVLRRMMNDHELATSIMKIYLGDMPRQIRALREYSEARDADGSGRTAHSIRGAAANVGGERLRKAALETEEAADAGKMDIVREGIAGLEAEFLLLKAKLQEEWFAEHKQPL